MKRFLPFLFSLPLPQAEALLLSRNREIQAARRMVEGLRADGRSPVPGPRAVGLPRPGQAFQRAKKKIPS